MMRLWKWNQTPIRALSLALPALSLTGVVASSLLLAACGDKPPAPVPPPPPATSASAMAQPMPPPPPPPKALDRAAWNGGAVRLGLPLFWRADENKDGKADANEVVNLLFYPRSAEFSRDKIAAILAEQEKAITAAAHAEGGDARQKLVREELDSAAPALLYNDLRTLSEGDRAFVKAMLAVGAAVDALFAKQSGMTALASQVPADAESQSLFRRSWGVQCVTPRMEGNKECTAIPGVTEQAVDVYPAAMQKGGRGFCADLEKGPQGKALLTPFAVVREKEGKLSAVGYDVAYKTEMEAVAKALEAAVAAQKDPQEAPLRTYLAAAAKSFRSNDWNPADEAWSKMTAENSKWYVRVAPDETYWEPCSQKAGFHMSFARIDPGSLAWQTKLRPVQQEMEDNLAKLLGAPYKARKVTFHLPDFIQIVTNHGDDRDPTGATAGQSLPNWGPVVKAGRGRTVVMTNLYADPDSLLVRRSKAASLLDAASMTSYANDTQPGLLSVILHEATHNFGPAHEYKVGGKTGPQAFGGDLASMMEELKAQTGGLYYIDFVLKKGLITPEMAKQTYVDSIVWGLNHIARGMYAGTKRKPYSQLAAVQIGFLIDEKAIVFQPDTAAENGQDKGALVIDFAKMPAAVDKLMKVVGDLKAKGDRAGAEALADKYAKGDTVPHKLIQERILRFPQSNFVYGLDL
jgi:hypothetical protein